MTMQDYDSVAVVSGGLDSTTLVYDMIAQGFKPILVSFDYGQRHSKELDFAAATGAKLMLHHYIISLPDVAEALTDLSDTALLRDPNDNPGQHYEVPDGHYAAESMKATVVPNRNMMMLSIAGSICMAIKGRALGVGVHAGDHFIYPDCRPQFIEAAEMALQVGNEGFGSDVFRIYAPFLHKSKADIAERALDLGVPLESTWSCYKGGDLHCGRCGTCVERLEAINEAQDRVAARGHAVYSNHFLDKTVYEDNEFWRTAIEQGA